METEEELILGKFKKTDVVVSLTNMGNMRKEGDLFKVLTKSSKGALYYKESINSRAGKEWRMATKEEKQAYEKGIKNIKDIVKSNEFLKGEYIITLDSIYSGHSFPKNFIFKQRTAHTYLKSELDVNGNSNNGFTYYTKINSSGKWRYATKEESDEYERRKKPYDVTELEKNFNFIVGKWYQFDCYNHPYIGKFSEEGSNIASVDWIVGGSRCTLKGTWPKSAVSNIRMLDASISHIQSYLPEDHPDKINPEFKCIPGEIYRIDWTKSNGDLVTIIFKPLTSEGHEGQVYYLSTTYNKFDKNNGVCTAPGLNIKFSNASLKEKQWLERCIKENKWVPMKQEGLIKGEIYKVNEHKGSIFMYDKDLNASYYIGDYLGSFKKNGGNFSNNIGDYIPANEEEKI